MMGFIGDWKPNLTYASHKLCKQCSYPGNCCTVSDDNIWVGSCVTDFLFDDDDVLNSFSDVPTMVLRLMSIYMTEDEHFQPFNLTGKCSSLHIVRRSKAFTYQYVLTTPLKVVLRSHA